MLLVAFAQAVLFRGADLTIVWPALLSIVAIGAAYFVLASSWFRRVIFGS